MKKFFLFLAIGWVLLAGQAWGYETLIDAQTAAATTSDYSRFEEGEMTFVAHGLSAGEEIDVQAEYADGLFTDLYDSDGDQIVLTSTQNIITIHAYGRYRLVKPVTSSAVTVVLYSAIRR